MSQHVTVGVGGDQCHNTLLTGIYRTMLGDIRHATILGDTLWYDDVRDDEDRDKERDRFCF